MSVWRSLGSVSSHRVDGSVAAGTVGVSVREGIEPNSHDIAVAIDHEGINVYSTKQRRCISSSPRPDGTVFTSDLLTVRLASQDTIVLSAQARQTPTYFDCTVAAWEDGNPDSLPVTLAPLSHMSVPVNLLVSVPNAASVCLVLAAYADGRVVLFDLEEMLRRPKDATVSVLVDAVETGAADVQSFVDHLTLATGAPRIVQIYGPETSRICRVVKLDGNTPVRARTFLKDLSFGASFPVSNERRNIMVYGSTLYFALGHMLRKVDLEADTDKSVLCVEFESSILRIFPHLATSDIAVALDSSLFLFGPRSLSLSQLDTITEDITYLCVLQHTTRAAAKKYLIFAIQGKELLVKESQTSTGGATIDQVGSTAKVMSQSSSKQFFQTLSFRDAIGAHEQVPMAARKELRSLDKSIAKLANEANNAKAISDSFFALTLTRDASDEDDASLAQAWDSDSRTNAVAQNVLVHDYFPRVSSLICEQLLTDGKDISVPERVLRFLCDIRQFSVQYIAQHKAIDLSKDAFVSRQKLFSQCIVSAKDMSAGVVCIFLAAILDHGLCGILPLFPACIQTLQSFIDEEITAAMREHLSTRQLQALSHELVLRALGDDNDTDSDAVPRDMMTGYLIVLNCCLDVCGITGSRFTSEELGYIDSLVESSVESVKGCLAVDQLVGELLRRHDLLKRRKREISALKGGKNKQHQQLSLLHKSSQGELGTLLPSASVRPTREEAINRRKAIGSYVTEKLEF